MRLVTSRKPITFKQRAVGTASRQRVKARYRIVLHAMHLLE